MTDATSNLRPYKPRAFPTIEGGDKQYLTQELQQISSSVGQIISALKAEWTPYTPIISASSGTIGSASATGRYLKIGKLVHVYIDILTPSIGTGGGSLLATLPFKTGPVLPIFAGREVNASGHLLSGTANGDYLAIQRYDNAFPGVSGYRYILNGTYECA